MFWWVASFPRKRSSFTYSIKAGCIRSNGDSKPKYTTNTTFSILITTVLLSWTRDSLLLPVYNIASSRKNLAQKLNFVIMYLTQFSRFLYWRSQRRGVPLISGRGGRKAGRRSREGKKRGEAARGSGNNELTFLTMVTYSSQSNDPRFFWNYRSLRRVIFPIFGQRRGGGLGRSRYFRRLPTFRNLSAATIFWHYFWKFTVFR